MNIEINPAHSIGSSSIRREIWFVLDSYMFQYGRVLMRKSLKYSTDKRLFCYEPEIWTHASRKTWQGRHDDIGEVRGE